ncbi:MAG: hypothetical protein ACOYNN_18010 [Terrimicrobiaceae bacterium]
MKTELIDDVVVMPKKGFKKEHKKLTKLLSRTQKQLKKEASEQKKEMKDVLKGGIVIDYAAQLAQVNQRLAAVNARIDELNELIDALVAFPGAVALNERQNIENELAAAAAHRAQLEAQRQMILGHMGMGMMGGMDGEFVLRRSAYIPARRDEDDEEDDERRRRRRERLIPPKETISSKILRDPRRTQAILNQYYELQRSFPEEIARRVIFDTYGREMLELILSLEAAHTMKRLSEGRR